MQTKCSRYRDAGERSYHTLKPLVGMSVWSLVSENLTAGFHLLPVFALTHVRAVRPRLTCSQLHAVRQDTPNARRTAETVTTDQNKAIVRSICNYDCPRFSRTITVLALLLSKNTGTQRGPPNSDSLCTAP